AGRGFNVHHQFKLDPPVMDRSQPAHMARFVPGSRMHAIFGDEHGVNSFHHQAVDKVADCFTITGVSPDGVTEAFENKLVTAVQWHPERMITDEMHKEIIRRYLKECESAAQQTL
ncbi:MAG: gamma-glutamyl-gamma-aminobutyrate hydrolase family protein, partial [Solobacterium sp.]|nr:gamma-glutamyl-gamma-aminobutyrate hydrolase family protein [Solobacterium sp.]